MQFDIEKEKQKFNPETFATAIDEEDISMFEQQIVEMKDQFSWEEGFSLSDLGNFYKKTGAMILLCSCCEVGEQLKPRRDKILEEAIPIMEEVESIMNGFAACMVNAAENGELEDLPF